MQKITLIISNLVNSVQVIVDVLINLIFQPVFALITIIQNLIQIWSPTPDETDEQEPQQTVTVYPSANEGKFAEECELPACEEHKIGYKINRAEQDEIKRIKEELNQK